MCFEIEDIRYWIMQSRSYWIFDPILINRNNICLMHYRTKFMMQSIFPYRFISARMTLFLEYKVYVHKRMQAVLDQWNISKKWNKLSTERNTVNLMDGCLKVCQPFCFLPYFVHIIVIQHIFTLQVHDTYIQSLP